MKKRFIQHLFRHCEERATASEEAIPQNVGDCFDGRTPSRNDMILFSFFLLSHFQTDHCNDHDDQSNDQADDHAVGTGTQVRVKEEAQC